MDYYFPKQKIYLTAPYKNGCTSALNYFVRIEKFLEQQEISPEQALALDSLKLEDVLPVHDEKGQYSAHNFSKELTDEDFENAQITIFIVRDPRKRFTSFWFNKIMAREEVYIPKADELFPKGMTEDLITVQNAAIRFLNELSKEIETTEIDGHLKRQIYSLKGRRYEFYVDTQNLNDLPKLLSDLNLPFNNYKVIPMPQINSTQSNIKNDFWSEDIEKAFAKCYSADLNLYELINGKPADPIETLDLLVKMKYNKVLLKQTRIKLEDIETSEAWRITFPVRVIITNLKKLISKKFI